MYRNKGNVNLLLLLLVLVFSTLALVTTFKKSSESNMVAMNPNPTVLGSASRLDKISGTVEINTSLSNLNFGGYVVFDWTLNQQDPAWGKLHMITRGRDAATGKVVAGTIMCVDKRDCAEYDFYNSYSLGMSRPNSYMYHIPQQPIKYYCPVEWYPNGNPSRYDFCQWTGDTLNYVTEFWVYTTDGHKMLGSVTYTVNR